MQLKYIMKKLNTLSSLIIGVLGKRCMCVCVCMLGERGERDLNKWNQGKYKSSG